MSSSTSGLPHAERTPDYKNKRKRKSKGNTRREDVDVDVEEEDYVRTPTRPRRKVLRMGASTSAWRREIDVEEEMDLLHHTPGGGVVGRRTPPRRKSDPLFKSPKRKFDRERYDYRRRVSGIREEQHTDDDDYGSDLEDFIEEEGAVEDEVVTEAAEEEDEDPDFKVPLDAPSPSKRQSLTRIESSSSSSESLSLEEVEASRFPARQAGRVGRRLFRGSINQDQTLAGSEQVVSLCDTEDDGTPSSSDSEEGPRRASRGGGGRLKLESDSETDSQPGRRRSKRQEARDLVERRDAELIARAEAREASRRGGKRR